MLSFSDSHPIKEILKRHEDKEKNEDKDPVAKKDSPMQLKWKLGLILESSQDVKLIITLFLYFDAFPNLPIIYFL